MDNRYRGARSSPVIDARSLLKAIGAPTRIPQTTAVISYVPSLTKILKTRSNEQILVQGSRGFGASSIALQIEILAAQGVQKIITMGLAGSLQPSLPLFSTGLIARALIDEGTSPHYGKIAGEWALPPKPDLQDHMGLAPHISAWTTDATLREYPEEVAHYQQLKIDCVEMEASAFYSVSEALGISALAFVAVSDELAGNQWKPDFNSPKLLQNLETLAEKIFARL